MDSPWLYVDTTSHVNSPTMSVNATNLCMDSLQDHSSGNRIGLFTLIPCTIDR